MEININGSRIAIGESTTFFELFQQFKITDLNGINIYRNNQLFFLQNWNSQVKGFLQANDCLLIQPNANANANAPYRPVANTAPMNSQLFLINAQQPVGLQQGVNPSSNQQFNFQQGQQQKIQVNQSFNQPFNQQFNQSLQQSSQQFNQQPQPIFSLQTPSQQQRIQGNGVFQQNNVQVNNQEEDVFATSYQNQTYDEMRQNYLRNKRNSPGMKQVSQVIDGYRFTLDNYGDELIIEKIDQSFWFRLNNTYKMNKEKRQSTPQSTQQFESNVRLDLNYTRVAWIQHLDILAVQFNTGEKIFMNLYME